MPLFRKPIWLEKAHCFAMPLFRKPVTFDNSRSGTRRILYDFWKCICQIILKHEDVAIPLFCRLIDSSPSWTRVSKLSSILHNHQELERTLRTSQPQNLPCCCNACNPLLWNVHNRQDTMQSDFGRCQFATKLHIFTNADQCPTLRIFCLVRNIL